MLLELIGGNGIKMDGERCIVMRTIKGKCRGLLVEVLERLLDL